jgi:hypothetical protein
MTLAACRITHRVEKVHGIVHGVSLADGKSLRSVTSRSAVVEVVSGLTASSGALVRLWSSMVIDHLRPPTGTATGTSSRHRG